MLLAAIPGHGLPSHNQGKKEDTMILEEAKELQRNDILHHTTAKNADGTPERWRVNGKVKTWKRDPKRMEVPVKYGLRGYGYITEDNCRFFNLA